MFQEIENLLLADERMVVIGSDLGAGLFSRARKEAPDRLITAGIQEQHIIGMAAGLAMEGLVPYVVTISTFLTRRCLEQIIVDVALHDVPVGLLGLGSGLTYAALGPTHAAVDDFALLRAIPGMTVLAPTLTHEALSLLEESVRAPRALYMRVPRGDAPEIDGLADVRIGSAVTLVEPEQVLVVSTGATTPTALDAVRLLRQRGTGAGLLHAHTVKPLDRAAVERAAAGVRVVVTVEEHLRDGGLGSAVTEALHDSALPSVPRVVRLGLTDEFITGYGSREDQLDRYGLTARAVADAAG